METPGFDLLVEFLFETAQAFRVCGDRADIFLKDNVLRGGGTDHLREPPEVGRAPVGTARGADIVPEQEGFETELGGLEVPQGIFAGAGEVAQSFIFHLGDIDRGKITQAHEPSELDSIPTVGFHAVARLFGNE